MLTTSILQLPKLPRPNELAVRSAEFNVIFDYIAAELPQQEFTSNGGIAIFLEKEFSEPVRQNFIAFVMALNQWVERYGWRAQVELYDTVRSNRLYAPVENRIAILFIPAPHTNQS